MTVIAVSVTGGIFLIDQEDRFKFCLEVGVAVSINKKGYVVFYYEGKYQRLHRWIMNAKPGEQVSHLDGNKLNNSKSNLKICTGSENCRNLNDKLRSINTSGYRGVSLHKASQKWKAVINGIYLGSFNTAEEAHAAYQRAAERYGFVSKVPEGRLMA